MNNRSLESDIDLRILIKELFPGENYPDTQRHRSAIERCALFVDIYPCNVGANAVVYNAKNIYDTKGGRTSSIADYASFSHFAMSFSRSNRGSSGSVMTEQNH